MKKMFSMILTAVVIFTMLSVPVSAKTTEEKICDNIVYELYSYHWENGKLYVQGCVANLNEKYDLVGLEDAIMVITDSDGLELCYVEVNDSFERNCILRPESKQPYNILVKKLLYDASEYTSLTSGLQVFFVSFTCNYAKCEGRGCEYCHNVGLALNDNPFVDAHHNTGRDTPDDLPNCFFCDLTGKCSSCDGDGEVEALSGSLWGTRCRTCEGSGVCVACGGDGVIGRS